MAITPLPSLDRTSATFKTELDTFFLSSLPTFSTQAESARLAIVASESAAASSAATATTQAGIATTQAGIATTQAGNAATSAASALNAPGSSATSTTSTLVTIQTGNAFSVGQTVVLASAADVANQMIGQITAHNSGTGSLTVNVNAIGGSGTLADWIISLSALNASTSVTWTGKQTFKGYGDTVYAITDGAAFAIDPENGAVQTVTQARHQPCTRRTIHGCCSGKLDLRCTPPRLASHE